MIKTETRIINGRELMYAYSDEGYMLIQDGTGYTYAEAYDPIDSGRTYMESEEKIPEYEELEMMRIIEEEELEK